MTFSQLRPLLLELRRSIAAGAETNTLLYFVDHICQLMPRVDQQHECIEKLKLEKAQLRKKMRNIQKDKKELGDHLREAKFELQSRMIKNQKLVRQMEKMRKGQARKRKEERKEQERKSRETNSEESLLKELGGGQKKVDEDMTLDEESIQVVEGNEYSNRQRLRSDDSILLDFNGKWFRGDNPEIQDNWQENYITECVREQYAIVCAVLDLADNKVQPKISNTKDQ